VLDTVLTRFDRVLDRASDRDVTDRLQPEPV